MTSKAYIIAAAALLAAQTLTAQNFNPKVEVTNTYEGKASDVRKQDVPMTVPDTLTSFVYKVDYSVFDNPYKGSYDFKPYMIEMRPDPKPSDASTLYLRAGAGYTLHPELEFVYTPTLRQRRLHMSVYDTFHGYYGPFGHCVEELHQTASAGQYIWGKSRKISNGYLFDNTFGINAERAVGKFTLGGDVAYHLLASKDSLANVRHMYHEGVAKAYFRPSVPETAGWFYGAELALSVGVDSSRCLASDKLLHYGVDAGTSFGVKNVGIGDIVGDVSFKAVLDNGPFITQAFLLDIAPRYVIARGRAQLAAGVKVSLPMQGDVQEGSYQHPRRFVLYPDVHASYFLVPDRLKAYLEWTGGSSINSYSSLLALNPYLAVQKDNLDFSSEKQHVSFGIKGSVASGFEYRAGVGYATFDNGLCDAVSIIGKGEIPNYMVTVGYCDYKLFHADVDLLWKSRRLDMEAGFRYSETSFDAQTRTPDIFAAAPYQAHFSATVNWNRRVFAGLSAEYVSSRSNGYINDNKGSDADNNTDNIRCEVPGFIDLGINAMYKIDSRWSVWARGGNLLNDAVQQYFLHCEKGVNFTLGICWNIR